MITNMYELIDRLGDGAAAASQPVASGGVLDQYRMLLYPTYQFPHVPSCRVAAGWQTAQLLPDSHPLLQGGSWTKYHLAVTQRKDDEPRSVASRFDTYSPGKPYVSLDDFIDGEDSTPSSMLSCKMEPDVRPDT